MTAKNDEIIDLLLNYNKNQCFFVKYEKNLIKNHKIIVLNRQGRLKHRFISEIWILNRFYDRFDGPK